MSIRLRFFLKIESYQVLKTPFASAFLNGTTAERQATFAPTLLPTPDSVLATHTDVPGEEKVTDGLQGSPAHGFAITPDQKTVWVTSKWFDYVAAYSLPDFKLVKHVHVGLHPEWLTIPPDGKNLYVAVAGKDATVVVDNKTMEVVATIPVGFVPKRNTSGMLQTQ